MSLRSWDELEKSETDNYRLFLWPLVFQRAPIVNVGRCFSLLRRPHFVWNADLFSDSDQTISSLY